MSAVYSGHGPNSSSHRVHENVSPLLALLREIGLGRGSVMVWGGISHGLKSQLVVIDGNLTAARYRDEILRPHVIPFLQQHNLTLQQDNARPHIARICQVFLANNNVQPLDLPQYSADLSAIEHLWDQLDRQVRQRQPPPATRAQLTKALVEECINALVNSMAKRIRAMTRENGGHT